MLNWRTGSVLQIDTERPSKEKVMTIRKSFRLMARPASLVLLALAVVPAIASDQLVAESEKVSFFIKFSGGPIENNFDISASYSSGVPKTCTLTLTLTDKDGKAVGFLKEGDRDWSHSIEYTATAGSVKETVGTGQAIVTKEEQTPLKPTLKAECHDKK
jgi:hypothetical protein